jgi:predicted AlkP superfamily pyrophosphatase or phosphodiesterase
MARSAPSPNKWLVVQVAGLGHDLATTHPVFAALGLDFHALESVFPALTCTAQATFRTAAPVAAHGMTANGGFHRHLRKVLFWEQASALVAGPRLWEAYRAAGHRVALLFWQQSLGESVDLILSPAPIHKHGGGLIDAVYSKPHNLYDRLRDRVGQPFRLHRYWGPLASPAASDWIADATCALLADPELAPDLCFTYLPALDYDLQRYGPRDPRSDGAVAAVVRELAQVTDAAARHGYECLVFGDYAIGPVNRAVFPNQVLREAGLFITREVGGRLYPDLNASPAFALVDHEIAHVHVQSPSMLSAVERTLRAMSGVGDVLDRPAQKAAGIDHPNGGDLVLVALPGFWFAYPWWTAGREAPDYAGHVDIHNKPGYDPCELFFGWPPGTVSRNPARLRGSHGRGGADRQTAWAATADLGCPADLIQLAAALRTRLESNP